MIKICKTLVLLLLSTVVVACASYRSGNGPLAESDQYYNYLQPSFAEYVDVSRRWLSKNRSFISADAQKELNMNAPFELTPKFPTDKAVLLVHGLGDSPYTFSDLSRTLVQNGFVVQVLLLPGHGSKPEDLMLPSYQDWQTIVDHYAGQLKSQYDTVWLGGFSTGANLVTIHALEKGNVDGLLLFSPGFQSQAGAWEKLTPLMASVFDWGWRAKESNLAKYSSSPTNAALAYTRSAEIVRQKLARKALDIPALVVLSEADSVIDTGAVRTLYQSRFTHPGKQMIWYGESRQVDDSIEHRSMRLPMFRISTASHMSVMFKPCNPYYGLKAEKRICENGFSRHDKAHCEKGQEVWFSAWGYQEDDKIHARLTWNPHYGALERMVQKMTGSDQS